MLIAERGGQGPVLIFVGVLSERGPWPHSSHPSTPLPHGTRAHWGLG